MEGRKKVYWYNQKTVEYWTHSEILGYTKISNDIGGTWELNSFKYHEQLCSDETFEKRAYGLIPY